MKKFNAYANKNCFQFIVDFSENHKFKGLSVRERVILSGYLTVLSRDTKFSKNNLYNLIFNFDGTDRTDKIESYSFYDKFVTDLTNMLKENPERFTFIKENSHALTEQGNHIIYRTQITADELKHIKIGRNTYESYMTKLYMIGVAKYSRVTQLNTISIHEYSKDHKNIGRIKNYILKFAAECDLVLDFDKKKKSLTFKKNNKVTKKSEIIETDKKQVEVADVIQDEIIIEKTLNKINDEAILLSLPADAHISVDLIRKYNETHLSKNCDAIPAEYKKTYSKYVDCINKIVYNDKDILQVLNGKFIEGSDGLSRKNTALSKIYTIQTKVFRALEKLHDENHACYTEVIERLRFMNVLIFDTGIKA